MGVVLEISIETKEPRQLIDVTQIVQEIVEGRGLKDGLVCLYVPHTGCAVSIHRTPEGGQEPDLDSLLEQLTGASGSPFSKAAIVAPTEIVIVKDGKLQMDPDQRVFYYEFDGPALRRLILYISS